MAKDSRLVYATESGRICQKCGKPLSGCTCKKKKSNKPVRPQPGFPDDGVVRIRKETKGRKGKAVTAVYGVPLQNDELQQLAKTLKQRCGSGGTVKNGVVLIQGDHCQTLLNEIQKEGFTVKLSGG
jgi:translation initiation factor 1